MMPFCLVWFLMQINVSGCNFAFWQNTGWGGIVANRSRFIAPSPASLAHVGGGEVVSQSFPSISVGTPPPTPPPSHSDHESEQGATHENDRAR